MPPVITRFPPSPTGYLHVGGARTALFNWLYARHTGGRFVLRIEDTDTARSTQAAVDAIFEALEWLGIDWDDGPYYQSRRLDIYQEYIDRLLGAGQAYYCTCTPDELAEKRQKALAAGQDVRYDGTCRERGLAKTPGAVVRFKTPPDGTTTIKDVVKGEITFNNEEIGDFVIQRSDGVPTYNFAVVVDDITMGINTIIRGDDHVSNTPKQILIYQALGEDLPVYGHVPMVLGQDRTKLSKRHGAMSVTAYREMGYLPEALINYLVRLGWSYGDQEFFTRDELIEKFSLESLGKSAGVFDPEKLLALNFDHIKAADPTRLAASLRPFLDQEGYDIDAGPDLEKIIATLNQRSKTLKDMARDAAFYFQDEIEFEPTAAKKFLRPAVLEALGQLRDELARLGAFSEKGLETVFKATMEKTGFKLGKIAQPVRVALTGKTASPGIFEIMDVLGPERVLPRLDKAIAFIEKRRAQAGK
jgi:glutamyl-tRNA synthetase